jgi:uridine phosphorylase
MGEDPRYHIRVQPGEVGGYVLLPGDRDRVERIAKHLQQPRLVAENREYRTITGTLDGTPVSVMSSGMGGPCVAIAVEELQSAGVHTIIRVGTTGAVGPGPRLGDAIIALAAVRSEGASLYAHRGPYPRGRRFRRGRRVARRSATPGIRRMSGSSILRMPTLCWTDVGSAKTSRAPR